MTAIEQLSFRNPVRPGLPVEAFTLAELRRRTGPGHPLGHYRLAFHQLLLAESGTAAVTVDFIEHACRPGTLLWTRPGQIQHGVCPPGIDGRIVLFTDGFLPAAPPLPADGYDTLRWDLAAEELGSAAGDLRRLGEDCAASAAVDLLRYELVVVLLRLLALPHQAAVGPPAADNRIYRLFRREVERRFRGSRSVEDYSPLVNCSARTLNRACRAATGRSAKQVIDGRVVLEAKRLLVHTDAPVAAIGRQLGFAEATNFVKYFALHTGVTPGRFRAGA